MSEAAAWSPKNPFIHAKKTPFLQRLSDRVMRGATLYIQGQTPIKGVPHLTSKLAQKWPLNLTKMQASRRRKAGHGTYFWLGWLDESSGLVHWYVLLNPGAQIDQSEAWKGVLEERIKVTGYELVRHTRKGVDKPSWTWRYTKARMESFRELVISHVRNRRDKDAEELMLSLHRSPGFAGVREQVKKLRQLAVAEWQRSRSAKDEMFPIPKVHGYVSRLADKGVPWSALVR